MYGLFDPDSELLGMFDSYKEAQAILDRFGNPEGYFIRPLRGRV